MKFWKLFKQNEIEKRIKPGCWADSGPWARSIGRGSLLRLAGPIGRCGTQRSPVPRQRGPTQQQNQPGQPTQHSAVHCIQAQSPRTQTAWWRAHRQSAGGQESMRFTAKVSVLCGAPAGQDLIGGAMRRWWGCAWVAAFDDGG
jgi:hypothetical protein